MSNMKHLIETLVDAIVDHDEYCDTMTQDMWGELSRIDYLEEIALRAAWLVNALREPVTDAYNVTETDVDDEEVSEQDRDWALLDSMGELPEEEAEYDAHSGRWL